MREPAQVGRDAMLLHSGINQKIDRSDAEHVGQAQPRHRDTIAVPQYLQNPHSVICARSKDAIDPDSVAKQHIVKGHVPSHYWRMWVVRKYNTPSITLEMDCDR
jgi:hypothetical protein